MTRGSSHKASVNARTVGRGSQLAGCGGIKLLNYLRADQNRATQCLFPEQYAWLFSACPDLDRCRCTGGYWYQRSI